MRWSEIAAGQPALGAAADEKMIKPGVLLVGTTRRDGTARISGVEPLIMDDDLWLSMMSGSAKALDLGRDPRILLHSIVDSPAPDAEIKIRGTVHAENDQGVQERYAAKAGAELGWEPVVGHFTLFRVDIDDVTYISYAPVVSSWPGAWPGLTETPRTATPSGTWPLRSLRIALPCWAS